MAEAPRDLVEMSWDPITRLVGSLGIHTTLDFANRQVVECRATSSIFRGYSVFMRGKDPRDAHFITSRICGICGDNHATCAVYAQNQAFGVETPPLGEWIINLAEAAEYMFDHNIFQDNLVGVDFCEQMVKETNPAVLARAETTLAPHGAIHGFRTVADIMRALNPFTGALYREALVQSRVAREMYCLMGGRHVHPSTLYPGGVGTVPSPQLFTEYLTRLMRYVDFVKRVVPLHDDLFDFMYQALPGYEAVGKRRVLLACWGAFQNPEVCDFRYET
jgi:hydrogenase large subunit